MTKKRPVVAHLKNRVLKPLWRCTNKSGQGCGGGLVVSVLAFYSDDPSSIPAEVYNFFCKIVVEKNENKQKEAGVGPIFF